MRYNKDGIPRKCLFKLCVEEVASVLLSDFEKDYSTSLEREGAMHVDIASKLEVRRPASSTSLAKGVATGYLQDVVLFLRATLTVTTIFSDVIPYKVAVFLLVNCCHLKSSQKG